METIKTLVLIAFLSASILTGLVTKNILYTSKIVNEQNIEIEILRNNLICLENQEEKIKYLELANKECTASKRAN